MSTIDDDGRWNDLERLTKILKGIMAVLAAALVGLLVYVFGKR